MTDHAARITAAREEIQRAEADLRTARAAFRAALVAAHDDGMSIAALGRILGVSRQRATELLREARGDF